MANLCCPRLVWVSFGQILHDESDWTVRFLDKQALHDLNEQAGATTKAVARVRDEIGSG